MRSMQPWILWALGLLAGAAIVLVVLRIGAQTPSSSLSAALPPVQRGGAASPSHAAAFLETGGPALLARRPVVAITLESMAVDDVRTSKVGGRPYWTSAREFPRGSDGEPLFLLAQIDFSAFPQRMKGYPQRGLLQFFVGETDFYGASFEGGMRFDELQQQRNFRVVYWDDTNAEPVTAPLRDSDRLPFAPTRPRAMRFEVGTEVLTTSDYRFDAAFGEDGMYRACERFAAQRGVDADALLDVVWASRSGTGHKIGGYPYFTRQDPRSGGPYELLFQLDSDEDMMWGDAGVAGFFIDPQDLARADFSRVAYSWDCS